MQLNVSLLSVSIKHSLPGILSVDYLCVYLWAFAYLLCVSAPKSIYSPSRNRKLEVTHCQSWISFPSEIGVKNSWQAGKRFTISISEPDKPSIECVCVRPCVYACLCSCELSVHGRVLKLRVNTIACQGLQML